MSKIIVLAALNVFVITCLQAQAPVIHSVNKYTGASGDHITITGSGFGSTAANLVVRFGAVKAPVTAVTSVTANDQLIETTVPAGATFRKISVTNSATGLTAYTNTQFLLSFGGEHPLTSSNLQSQTDFPSPSSGVSSRLYDLTLCDLDGDNRNDIIATNNATNYITIFRNTSSSSVPTFTRHADYTIGKGTLHVRCADLNGDGKPDIILSGSENTSNQIFVIQNNSTSGSITLAAMQTLTLTGKRPKRIEVADLDLDGKPELIISDQGQGVLTVLPNTSAGATISFSSPQTITVTGTTSTDGIAVEDLNGDQLPDLVLSQQLLANVFLLKNTSTPGNIKLENQPSLTISGTIANVRTGDLDGDGKSDIAVTRWLSSGISVFLNQGAGQFSFSPPTTIVTDSQPWGLDYGDLDGDKKNDIVVASTQKTLTVLNNTSTPGNLSFQKSTIATTFINRHVAIGDLNSDSKPDIAFTSIDDETTGIDASKVSIIRNRNCFVPVIDQTDPITLCSSFSLRLNSTLSANTTFEWKKDGTTVATGTNAFYDIPSAPGTSQYTVTAISEGGNCSKTSNAVAITVEATAAVGAITFSSNAPVCINGTLTASVADASNVADGFDWTGPDGFTASGNSVTRAAFKAEHAGEYKVDVKIGSCVAAKKTLLVGVVAMPDFKVGYAGAEVICSGDNKILSASPAPTDFSYQWFESASGSISGQTTSSYTTTQSGEYYFEAQSTTYPSCPPVSSAKTKIAVVATPVVTFTAPAEACKGSSVQFSNQSVTDPASSATYAWTFGDGQTSALESPAHSFASVQTFNVKLAISYAGGNCPAELSKTIKISDAPIASITTPGNVSKICDGETLLLEVSAPFTSYAWSSTVSTPSITISKAGTYTVDVTNAIGCAFKLSKTIDALPAPQVVIDAQPSQITAGDIVQLSASGLVSYEWSPGQLLSSATISNPTTAPLETTVFTVTGKGINGCVGKGTVEVSVKGEAIVNRLKPSNFFSPNGDAVNNVWSVDNILSFPQCMISIFDDKGVKLYEAKPYNNDWDGSSQGKLLPNGVYFYIIRCDGEENSPKAGSITLIR